MHAYYFRVQTADSAQAVALAAELDGREAWVRRERRVVEVVWPQMDSAEPDDWDEEFPSEFVFWLRSWADSRSGTNVTVLDRRPLEISAPPRAYS
jgi:broad specificity phosphatase PhoE